MVYTRIKQLYFDDPKTSLIVDKKNVGNKNQDCEVCRYVSGVGLSSLGIYVIKMFYDDIKIDKTKSKFFIQNNKSNNIYGFLLGTFFVALGVARLTDFHFPNSD